MIKFKQKIFFQATDGTFFTKAQAETATGLTGADAIKKFRVDQASTNAANLAARQTERAAGQAVGTEAFKQAAKTGGKDAVNTLKTTSTNAYKAGQTAGAKSVGLMGGLKNTWAKAGTGGKAGMLAAGAGVGLLAAKGLGLIGNKKEKSYSFKRATFSDKKSMGTGAKVLLGAGTAVGTVAAAKKGVLGNKAAMGVNKVWAKAGKKIGGKVGDNMMLSGASDYGKASARDFAKNLAAKRSGGATKLTKEQISVKADRAGNNLLTKILK